MVFWAMLAAFNKARYEFTVGSDPWGIAIDRSRRTAMPSTRESSAGVIVNSGS